MVITQSIKNVKKTNLNKINAGTNLSCIRNIHTSYQFATGGNENPLKIWNLESGTIEFTAKSVSLNFQRFFIFSKIIILFYYLQPKPDMLQLKQPCNISDIRFFNNNKVVVSHRHGVVNINLI